MNIIADSGTKFDTNGEGLNPAMAYLDDTHFVIAYKADYGSYTSKVVCGTISGVTPTLGTAVEFDSEDCRPISVARLDSTHFVIAWTDKGASNAGKCRVGSVSGTTITLGTVVTFEANAATEISVCGMDSTHFVIAYYDSGSNQGEVIGASVSGTTITAGTPDVFESSTDRAQHISVCSTDSSHFVISYKKLLNNYDGRVVCGTLSGNTVSVTADSSTQFESGTIRYTSISALSATHFVIAFGESTYWRGTCIVGSVSGTTITISADTGTEFTGNITGAMSCTAISSMQFIVAFRDQGDSYKGKVVQGSVSGTTITMDSINTFENGNTNLGIDACTIMGDYCGISFTDIDDSSYGKVIIGRYSAIRSGEATISAVPSLSIDGNGLWGGTASISSIPSLVLTGNLTVAATSAINIITAMSAFGGTIKQGESVMSIVSRLIAVWEVRGICSIQSVPAMSAEGMRLALGEAGIDIESSVDAVGQTLLDGGALIGVIASLAAVASKWRMGEVSISSASSMSAAAIAYIAQTMGYTGTLAAGDVLIIDCDEQTVTLNGANATKYFTGTFSHLYVGTNELRWKDGGEVPDLDFETAHDARYL